MYSTIRSSPIYYRGLLLISTGTLRNPQGEVEGMSCMFENHFVLYKVWFEEKPKNINNVEVDNAIRNAT